MRGTDARTGAALTGLEHLRQSVGDVLGTRIGTRVMRREFGSRLPELVDAPLNDGLRAAVAAATVEALRRWEPRLRVRRVRVAAAPAGSPARVHLDLEGEYVPDGSPVALAGIPV